MKIKRIYGVQQENTNNILLIDKYIKTKTPWYFTMAKIKFQWKRL